MIGEERVAGRVRRADPGQRELGEKERFQRLIERLELLTERGPDRT